MAVRTVHTARRQPDLALVEELARRIHEAEQLARTDALTGLLNRRAWDEALPIELDRARRTQMPLCLAIVDLDKFKAYNDRHGHLAGDRLLAQAGTAWSAQLRSTDVLARYGGEEFALALPCCPLDDALELAQRLREAVPGCETASIGLAQWDGAEAATVLIERADAALYRAKAAGRDRAVAAPGNAPRARSRQRGEAGRLRRWSFAAGHQR